MDRLLLGILDDKTREELLSTYDLTLSKTIEICRAKETTSPPMKALKTEEVNKVKDSKSKKKKRGNGKHKHKPKDKSGKTDDLRSSTSKEKSGKTDDLCSSKRI